MRKQIFLSFLFTSILVLIVLVAVPQDTTILNLLMILLSYLFLFPIIIIGNPSLQLRIDQKYAWLAPIYTVFVPVLILLIFTGEILNLDRILIWYLLPGIILLSPKIISDARYKTILYVLGAILLWIGFDHRYTGGIFDAFEDLGYVMNSLWMVCIGFVTYGIGEGIHNKQNDSDRGLLPSTYASIVANKFTVLASVIIIPLGLLTSFLIWNPQEFDLFNIIISFIGIALTIGLQEEMIFRGIILKELDKYGESVNYQRVVLVLVSILFGFTHWNNATSEYFMMYFITATIAGIAYGLSFRKAGLFSAILSHTLIDWFWALLLKRP
ncbi:MAG: CPBP family intramembrane metalloprotease [Candidatus Heimdallarchaeota archaeon]|nr:CPBP family intramembrane metalloprotease [Candidatus Heimdallarchaeota archaeon]